MSYSNGKIKDARLLEALDHLDLEYIDDVIDVLKVPPANAAPEPNRKNTILSVKLFIALAAVFLLISSFIPIVSYIIRNHFFSPGGIETTAAEESTVETEAETTAPEIFDADGFNYHVREDRTLSVYYRGKAEEIVVPEEIDGKKVTAIAAKGFVTAADTLKKVTLPETIEQIGEQAFANCTLLSEINLPDSLTSIGVWAFDHCTSLKHLCIPAHAFDGGFDEVFVYSGLETVELAEGIEKIPLNTFYKSNLKEITLPSSLREIGACAFLECHYLKVVNMNEGLEKIGDFAFMNIGAESISIPASVNAIGRGAFMSCWQMKSITVDQSNKTFYTWGNCVINRNTKTLVIGYGECVLPSDGSVTAIGDSAMGGTPITDLTVPDAVTSIGNGAFSLCTKLKSISLPSTLKSIGGGAFGGCTSLESIALPYGIKRIEETTFSACTNLKSIDIPYGIEFIGEMAFASCENLTEIDLPDSLTEIGNMAFYACTSLKKVTIPTSVTVIPERLFNSCSSLEKVTIGFKTSSIGAFAFSSCPKLTNFIFSGTASEWYGVQTEPTWNTSSAFDSIQCLDGIISLHTTMSADEAIKAAITYWKLDESQPNNVWIKYEPSATAQRFMVSRSGITENGEIGIIAEVYVDIYTGNVSDVVYDFSDMPTPLGEVILNKRKFVETDGDEYYLKDYVCGSLGVVKIAQGLDYTVIDLDGDGTEELLISETQGTVLFHIAGDKVRAYEFGFRALMEPKTDGTFEWTDLMFSGKVGVSRLSFTDEGYKVEDICYTYEDVNQGIDREITYFIGDREVTKEEYDAYEATLSNEAATWHDLNYYPTEMIIPGG